MPNKDKIVNLLKKIATILIPVLLALLAFMWNWQRAQDGATSDNSTKITTLEVHQKNSQDTFDQIRNTLEAQGKLIMDTRETLSAVRASQQNVTDALKELRIEVRILSRTGAYAEKKK